MARRIFASACLLVGLAGCLFAQDSLKALSDRLSGGTAAFDYSFSTAGADTPFSGSGTAFVSGSRYNIAGNGLDIRCDGAVRYTADPAAGERYADKYCYFNENGIAIVQQNAAIEGIPEVLGITVTGWTSEEKVAVAQESASDFDDVCGIAKTLSGYDMQIAWIAANGDRTFTLIFDNIQVQLGKNVNMDEKISELADLWDELKGRSGILHLENYDSGTDSIIFTQN